MNAKRMRLFLAGLFWLSFLLPPFGAYAHSSQHPDNILTVGDACQYHDLQSAIDAAVSGDTIRAQATTTVVFDNHIKIQDKALTFDGGYDSTCTHKVAAATTLVDAQAHTLAVEIHNTGARFDVIFHNFDVTGGIAEQGGGILAQGHVALILYDSAIHGNQATQNGGGIALLDGAFASINNTKIYNNGAGTNGGGIYCANSRQGEPGVSIYDNSSIGWFMIQVGNPPVLKPLGNQAVSGGGIYTQNCGAVIDRSKVMYNQADRGGGIYNAYPLGGSYLRNASQVIYNSANTYGGGVYLDRTSLGLEASSANYNKATNEGGGIYATGSGAKIWIQSSAWCSPPRCSQVSYNSAVNGAALWAGHGADIDVDQTYITNNTSVSGPAVYLSGQGAFHMADDMITENDIHTGVISLANDDGGAWLGIASSTIANNNTHGGEAFQLATTTILEGVGLVIWGNDTNTVTVGGGSKTITCSILAASFPGSGNLVQDPLFVNPTGHNYNLQSGSPAIDHCAADARFPTMDIDGAHRPSYPYPIPATIYDAGADEYQFYKSVIFLPVVRK